MSYALRVAGRDHGWLMRAPGRLERFEACFTGSAYSPHRHDTYTICITVAGVQAFDYRGANRCSRPGQLVVLHPDELHDGRAGDTDPFRYRTAYIAPAEIQAVLAGPLPFVASAVTDDARLRGPARALLGELDRALGELEYSDALYDLAHALRRIAGGTTPRSVANRVAAARARDYMLARLDHPIRIDDLERETGHDRWQLSRDFRALYGTSPHRFMVARRLDAARAMLLAGSTTADTAHACGFADQSHFGRAFKKTFGMTPNAWATLAQARARSF